MKHRCLLRTLHQHLRERKALHSVVLSEAVEAEAAGDWVQVCRAAVASAESKEGGKEAEAKVAVTVV